MNSDQKKGQTIVHKIGRLLKISLSKYGLWWAFLGLIIFASILSPRFISYRNITNILRQVSILGVLAVGMTYVILNGGIDLSVGGVMAFSCVLVPVVSPYLNDSVFLIILVCLFAGSIIGAITGTLIAQGHVQPFIATLGMTAVAEGLAFIMSNGRPIILEDSRWGSFGNSFTAGMPNLAIVFIIIIIIGQFVLSKSVFGTYIYAIGNNEEAVQLSGVRTKLVKTFAYIISGLLASLGGLMMTARISVGDPGVGSGYALDVIAAVVVGGTRLGGGYGSVINTLLGAAIIGVLNNVFNLMGVSPYPQMVFKGIIIIAAVLFEQLRKNR
ncbi:MAG: ABC transporter permease [Bacteroidetes bacterium]|nr:ABC transporter permease [Bacteroidota bacterium]